MGWSSSTQSFLEHDFCGSSQTTTPRAILNHQQEKLFRDCLILQPVASRFGTFSTHFSSPSKWLVWAKNAVISQFQMEQFKFLHVVYTTKAFHHPWLVSHHITRKVSIKCLLFGLPGHDFSMNVVVREGSCAIVEVQLRHFVLVGDGIRIPGPSVERKHFWYGKI